MVRRLGNFFLRVSALDRFYHAAHPVEFAEVVQRPVLHLQREIFKEIRSAQGIDGLRDARFVGDDLLGAQGNPCSLFRGKGERFVIGVRV